MEGADFAAPKLRQWQMSMNVRGASRFPDLPKITLEDTPSSKIELIKQWYLRRDWEKCSGPGCNRSGTDCRLRKCAGCGNLPVRRTYYCSTKCQRAGWSEHQERCHNQSQALEMGQKQAIVSGVDLSIWSLCKTLEYKRVEGLHIIWLWAFNQLLLSYPRLDLREFCLSIHCRSSKQGGGSMIPVAYQIQPIVDPSYKLLVAKVYNQRAASKVGIIVVSVDGVLHEPKCVDLNNNRDGSEFLIEQWPWTFASIVMMRPYNRQLANYRLQHLYPVIETLALMGRPEVTQFRIPKNLDNGKRWELYDFDKWKKLFGNVISF